jgi:two-component system chemotaxis response regulator CheB
MIQVLVAEDSATIRQLLVAILQADPEIRVVGEARNGVEAVTMTKSLQPSVVTMDIQMPRMDGFDATRRIMVESPTPIVIVSKSNAIREVGVSMQALHAGALAALSTPLGPEAPDFEDQARRFVETIKAMSRVKIVRRWVATQPPPISSFTEVVVTARVVALAASTGGPSALARILSELRGDFPPVLIVQHIAPGFVEGFAAWLNAAVPLRVKVAQDGEPLVARTVYVAPDDGHMGVDGSRIMLSRAPAIDGFRPSATFMFESVARAFGPFAVTGILTGMGRDGVAGLRMIRAAGGRILAQDEASCVVFGMPGAAISEGLVDATLPLGALAQRLREWSDRERSARCQKR